jgi:hypothetical protein
MRGGDTRSRAIGIANGAILPHWLAFHVARPQLVLERHVDALLHQFAILFRSFGKVRLGFTLDQKPCLICAFNA